MLTPLLMVLILVTGDFLAMSTSTDNVAPSRSPSVWHIRQLTIAAIVLGLCDLAFCVGCLLTGKYLLRLDDDALRTLTVVTLVFSGQAVFYIARERRHLWSSRPGSWLVVSSVIDIAIISTLAGAGLMMTALPVALLVGLLGAAMMFALVLDGIKVGLFGRLGLA